MVQTFLTMKKLFILGVTLLAFAACKNGMTGKNASADSITVKTQSDIAYVRMDSVSVGYNRAVDLLKAFEEKANKVQKELLARERGLQRQATSLQEKAENGLMTRADIAAEQEKLQRNAGNLQVDQQNKMEELAEEQMVLTNQINYAIKQYIKKFNADGRYKMIFSTTDTSSILYGDPSMDITAEILVGLNAEYAAEKKKK